MEIKIKNEEIRTLLEIESPEFPRYVTQLLNLANQNAQATRPKVVGQMSELIKEFNGRTIEEWEKWYLERYPDAIDKATEKIFRMIENFKGAIEKIDRNMVRQWVWDLVIVKTFLGLRFQEAILRKISEKFGLDYRLASPEEEKEGIDGYIGNIPVSLKPESYDLKKLLPEKLNAYVIYYEKQKDGLKVFISEDLENLLKKEQSGKK